MEGERSERHPIDLLGEEFVARYRRGERPSVTEFARRYPEWADQVQELLQALVLMEELRPSSAADSASSERSAPLLASRQLGEYRILREVGRGGMGVVYEAEQESLGRRVALKVLAVHRLLDPAHLERFRREAKAAARLHHTNIVPVFGVGEQDGVSYYAMQFIEGRGLDEILGELRKLRATNSHSPNSSAVAAAKTTKSPESSMGQGQLTPLSETDQRYFQSAARIGVQVAEALAYAHSQGIVHRDIKPSNLMLDTSGTVWVTDFGLARTEGPSDLTQEGDIPGTLRYMAPERFDRRCDRRSDVYSLGLTLYELLTLRPPFDETERGLLIKQVTQSEPPRPRRLNRRIPRDLETIVLKAIEKQPDRRYQSAEELADDLRRFQADVPIRAQRIRIWGRIWRWCRRNPALAFLTISVLVLLVVIGAGASVAAWRLDAQLEQTRQAEHRAQRRLFESLVAQARASRVGGRPGQKFESLQALTEAAGLVEPLQLGPEAVLELRHETIASAALTDVRFLREWEGFPPGTHELPVFDGPLQHYARGDHQGNISIRRVADDKEVSRLPGEGTRPYFMTFSPDGHRLAVRYSSDLFPPKVIVWDWRKREMIFQCTSPQLGQRAVGFSPDSQQLAVGRDPGVVTIYDLATGKDVKGVEVGASPWHLAFAPDEKRLAVSSLVARAVFVHDLSSGKLIHKLPHPRRAWNVAWHPDGNLLAVACDDFHVYLWNSTTGQQHAVLRGHTTVPVGVGFSQNGELLSTWAWDGTTRLWNPWSGRQLVQCPGVDGHLSGDGRSLVTRHQTTMRLWQVASGEEYRSLPHSPLLDTRRVYHFEDVSPDGRWLAVGGEDGVRLWDLALRTSVGVLPIDDTFGVAFHPQGQGLFTSGRAGLFHWPVKTDGDLVHVGPPSKLPVKGYLGQIALDKTGHALAVCNHQGAFILDPRNPAETVRQLDHPTSDMLALSPDGQWVATAPHNGRGIKVWEARTGKLARELLEDTPRAQVYFSPESRHLVTVTTETAFWSVGSSQVERRLSGSNTIAWTSDGSMLAIPDSSHHVHLLDAKTGQLLAVLEAPQGDPINRLHFRPDGSQLISLNSYPPHVGVWDLRRIRSRLGEMGLDWDLPAYTSLSTTPSNKPARVEVLLGELAPKASTN